MLPWMPDSTYPVPDHILRAPDLGMQHRPPVSAIRNPRFTTHNPQLAIDSYA